MPIYRRGAETINGGPRSTLLAFGAIEAEQASQVAWPEWRQLEPIWVASGGNVGGTDAAVEPTRTYSRRFPEEVTHVGGAITQRQLLSKAIRTSANILSIAPN